MAVDEQVAKVVAHIAAVSQDRLGVRLLWQHDPGGGFDCVVEI
jgi:hypothetical protein